MASAWGLIYHGPTVRETGSGLPLPTMMTTRAAEPERRAVVLAEGIWKVFGPHGDRIIGTPDAELSDGAAREDRNVVAVRDVSIVVHPARSSL